MSTILVTGGAGFIGSNFVRLFQKKYRIINFDKLTYAATPPNPPLTVRGGQRGEFVRGDITDQKAVRAVFKKYKPDYLVNFAAETHVDRSIHGYAADFVQANVYGVFTLLEAAKKFGIKKYVQVSTDEVYGDVKVNSKKKFTEDAVLRPSSPYSSTKAAGDLLCLSYYRTYGVPVVVTRGSNTYGPYQFPEKLIPFFVERLLEGKKMPLYGDGKNTRDWLYVDDHARAIERVLMRGKPGEIYNISADEYHTNRDIAVRIAKHFRKSTDTIQYVADRPGHDRKYTPDSTKLRRELNWEPRAKFDDAFEKTLEWFEENL